MDEEEWNCWRVHLLLARDVDRLRQHFVSKWNGAGTFMPWIDCAQNGRDLLTKFKPLPHEKDKVKSGDTTKWDLSLLVKVLLNTRPPFVTNKILVNSLECLRKTRNTVCHTPNGKITTADFNKLWSAACNALTVFGATSYDFKKIKVVGDVVHLVHYVNNFDVDDDYDVGYEVDDYEIDNDDYDDYNVDLNVDYDDYDDYNVDLNVDYDDYDDYNVDFIVDYDDYDDYNVDYLDNDDYVYDDYND